MVVAEGGRAVHRVFLRILCVAGCALGFAFLLALLVPSAGTAHASSLPSDSATSATLDLPANGTHASSVDDSTLVTDSPLWSDPSVLSATATRRANGDVVRPAPRRVAAEAAPEHPGAPSGPTVGIGAPAGLASTLPAGSLAAGGGSAPDAGPSITQLAVLSAALVGVRWLSQRLRASGLPWRNVLITLSIERPG
jgi:hypothetical protein